MTAQSALRRYTVPLAAGVLFVAVALAFFAVNAPAPLAVFGAMVQGAYGDGFALSISLVKATPILLCALSVALPARMGLITVGAEGQLYFGALTGTGAVLALLHAPAWELIPAMLAATLAGGALWGAVPGLLRARLSVNETIVTILLNYVAIRLVDFTVYGPWKDAADLGWPATISFPAAAVFPAFTIHGTTIHAEFIAACAIAVAMQVLVSRSRWGLSLTLLRSNRRAAAIAGVNYARNAVAVMAIAGMLAGFAGIVQAADVQGRLQPDISVGYGLSGFLVAWLAGQNFLRIIPLSLLMGGLTASADALQLFAQLPFASTVVLQGLLFGSVLALNGWLRREQTLKMHAVVVFVAQLLLSGVRSSTPVLLVLLGETLTQRVGVINLGVEGEMLVGAAGGFAVTAVTANPWLGLAAAMLAGMLLSAVHALLCLGFKANQIASGVCVLTLGSGLSAYYGAPYVGRQIAGFAGLTGFASMPALAPLLAALTPTVVIAIVLTPVIAVWLYKTRTGLIWRTVGESTEAARMVGIKPWRVQLAGILAGGLLAGLGGAALSVDYTRTWVEGMTAGRGLVAVGLVVVARWNPWLALPAALLFGGSEALYLRLQSMGVTVSPYLLSTLPYLIPLAVLLVSYRSARSKGGMPQELTAIFKGVQ